MTKKQQNKLKIYLICGHRYYVREFEVHNN